MCKNMNMPKSVKIGGKVYRVEVTDKLTLGKANVSAEIDYMELVIRIHPSARGKMEADFWHEVVHGILDHLGYRRHNEKKVDELANALYMVISDNPKIFVKDNNPKPPENSGQ